MAWIGAKIPAIRCKFLWEILQSSRAFLQTLGHVSGSIVRGPAVVVLVINSYGSECLSFDVKVTFSKT